MSDKSNIDKLFREGLGSPTPHAFSEAGWDNMNSMLNEREKFSWMSVGKLASAALFLSTVLIGSNIPDNQLIASSETTTQNTEVNSPLSIAQNSISLATNNSSNFGFQKEDSFVRDSDFSSNQLPENKKTNKTLVALTRDDVNVLPGDYNEEDKTSSSSIERTENSIESSSEGNIDVIAFNNEFSNIDRITPSSLESIEVDFAEYGFDPVAKSTMPKVLNQSLSIFGGITLENGLGSVSQLSRNNFLYTAGFYYNLEASENISISTGLGYRSKSGKGIELSRTQTEYGFGKSQTTETLALNRLHYIDLPVEVRYDIKGKHTVFGGASISYLAGVKSAIAKTNDESFESSTSSIENTWNYTDGLNKWDAGVKVGYDYNLGRNLSIGGMLQYGLMDITSNETFEIQDNSNNMEVRVTLKYTPFRF
jgi:hypothetical protein